MKINKVRNNLLNIAKPYVVINGWNDDLFSKIRKSSNYKNEEIKTLFPEGYKTLIEIYLDEINDKMTKESKKIDLIHLRVHQRVRELIILRLKIMLEEKELVTRTFMYLLLPFNHNIALRNLYKTVDQIWFLSGDHSTDFNYYSKRTILGSIYFQTMIHFINNNNIDETISILNKQLKRVSNIPKIKSKSKDMIKLIPQVFKLGKTMFFFKQ